MLQPYYKMLPTFPCDKIEENSSTKACELSVIGVNMSLSVVENAILTKRLLPVHKSEFEKTKVKTKKNHTFFCKGNACIMLPQSFVKHLSPAFLHQWLSLNPVDTVALGHPKLLRSASQSKRSKW